MRTNAHRLIEMANQIGQNFDYEEDPEVVAERVATHLNKFWDPRMMAELLGLADSNSEELSTAVLTALKKIKAD